MANFAPVNIFFSLGSLRRYETLEGCLDAALRDAGFEGPYRASPPPEESRHALLACETALDSVCESH